MTVERRNQSSLNHTLSKGPFSVAELNEACVDLLQSLPGTQLKPQGVLSINDTLLKHYGQHLEQYAKLLDLVNGCHVWAHSFVTLRYRDDETGCPVFFQPLEIGRSGAPRTGPDCRGLRLCTAKRALQTQAPDLWKAYLFGVWRRKSKTARSRGVV